MPTTRLALIGAGIIGKTHIDRIQRHPDLALAGIADPTPAGQALADELGVPWAADPALDDLVVTGPTNTNVNDFRAILVL